MKKLMPIKLIPTKLIPTKLIPIKPRRVYLLGSTLRLDYKL